MAKSKNKPVELIGKITKVVRTAKDVAQVTIEVRREDSELIQIGEANLTIDIRQKEMEFGRPVDEDEE